MRSAKVIHIVNCHAEGEVGDVIVGGVAPPPGDTLWAQSRSVAQDQTLRNFVLNEPRGGVFRHVNLLVPPKHPDAAYGFIIMEPIHTPPMSGSNSICVATVLLDTGLVPMIEPETVFHLEAPGGLIKVRASCANGKATSIEIENVPSFVDKRDAQLEVAGVGTLTVDTAYGGDSFVFVDAPSLGFAVRPDEARDLAEMGAKITAAATEQLGFYHPANPDWSHISFTQFAMPVERIDGVLTGRNTVVIDPGKLDRCPTGTGCSARMALLHAQGHMAVGDRFVGRSILDSQFECSIMSATQVGERKAIVPTVRGRAWVSGMSQLLLDPTDPWPQGYRVGDTWPINVAT